MSDEGDQTPEEPDAPEPGAKPDAPEPDAAAPDEEELRRRIEEGLREVRLQDVLLESVVTMVNLTARRIAKEDEQDLEQARVGIEAVRALVELLEPEPQTQVRNALSELQMLYARAAGGESGEAPSGTPADDAPPASDKGPSGLWTPPGA